MGQLHRVLHTFKLDDCGRYMKLYPAGAMVLLTGMICILAIPPSGMFISELMIFRGLAANGQWFVLITAVILLSFVIYAMSTRVMHITFSDPRDENKVQLPGSVSPVETVSQYLLLAIVIVLCFYQPPFLVEMIDQTFASLPR
jgi:hydrogenase-4 component F